MNFGTRIRRLRTQRGWNQHRLAIHSGLTQATISRIERGQVRDVGLSALAKLAEALGVSTDYLVGRSADPAPRPYGGDPFMDQVLKLSATLDRFSRRQALAYLQFLTQQQAAPHSRQPGMPR